MASAANTELVEQFEQFYRDYYRDEIGELARKFPNEKRSLYVDWQDLYRFDPDLADDYLSQPEQLREHAEEALRVYDLPVDVKLGGAHVRVRNLPETTGIRDLRSQHVNNLVSIQGIVRKATDVRPKIQEAAFECQRCGTLSRVPQSEASYQEPHECQGCERQGPFRLNVDQSEFVDAQQIRVQESPEGLRGGETPRAMDVRIEDDLTGEVTPGDHVTVTGILRLEQGRDGNQESSPVFDTYVEGITVEVEEEQFEDMEITEADKKEIIELSQSGEIYERMVGSIAPSIYGYEQQKLAIVLQLFSGVTKHLPDGTRIRGDLHMLLIGDPGTGKCVRGDTKVTLADGREREISDLVESNLEDPEPVDDGVYDDVDIPVPSFDRNGRPTHQRATRVWKREAPDRMYRIRTASGKEIEVTPSHPMFVRSTGDWQPVRAENLSGDETIAGYERALGDGGVAGNTTRQMIPEARVTAEAIDSIESVDPDYDWVYDLEVEETHSYVSNGLVSHNSQLLQYVQKISPRSVYTSGKGASSAGLCVTGDTLIHSDDGFRRIDELVEEELPRPVETETTTERAIDLYTYDEDTGEVQRGRTSNVWRMPEKRCRRIETANGKRLEASVNTPVLTCGDEGIEWVPVSDVEPGDHVAVPKYRDVDRSTPPVSDYLEFTNEKVKLSEESVEFVRDRLLAEFGTLRTAASALDLSQDFVYDSLSNRFVPVSKLDRILDAVDATRQDVDIRRAMLRHGDDVRLPRTFDENLLYLVGLVFGDGDIRVDDRDGNRGMVRISNGDERILERAVEIIEETFDRSPEIERQDDRVPCLRLHSATIARLFENVGMATPKTELELDHQLTTAEHVDAFVRGLMDADGSVSDRTNGGSSVQFSTVSDALGRQLQLILETFGVHAKRRERDRRGTHEMDDGRTIESKQKQTHLEIYGRDIDTYADRIGFGSGEKKDALDRIVDRTDRRGERLPIGDVLAASDASSSEHYTYVSDGGHPGREKAETIIEDVDLGPDRELVENAVRADLRWDEVVDASDAGFEEVFDLTVPGTNNFLGNGIVTHNTAAAVRDDFGDGQQWTLEAGALVLADQGIAAVDELDKMKCVTGDTLVRTGDRGLVRIGELARREATSGTIEQLDNGRTIRDVDVEAWTMTDDGRIARRPVTAIHEYEAPDELCEVRLESGESVTTTADHPFFVLEDGDRVEKPAEELEDDDWVYIPRELPSPSTDGGAVATESDVPEDSGPLTPARGAILGYIAGDGNVFYDRDEGSYGIRFTNTEEQLLAHFEDVCRTAFDAEPTRPPSERRDDGVETVRLTGKEYVDELLAAGANLESFDGKCLPEEVTRGSRETKAAFVRALADSEGHVDDRNVRIASSSYDLLLGVKTLLLEFGITSQIQTDERDGKRDCYRLAITAADSLSAFQRHVGFTLDRKRESLEAAVEATTGDRTILDVVPECGRVLAETRADLRLYQSECGINPVTYCNFENGDANVSLRLVEDILDSFDERRERAAADARTLETLCSWDRLQAITERYHVSQRELAEGIEYPQQAISERWGKDEDLRAAIRRRLGAIVAEVAETDLKRLRELATGNVKWRRVSSVERVEPTEGDDRIPILRHEVADLIGGSARDAVERAHELLDSDPDPETWDELRTELDRWSIPLQRIADRMDVANSTVSRWFNGVVDVDNFETVRDHALTLLGERRSELQVLVQEIDDRRVPKVYDLTVERTHNFLANGIVVHNSEDRSAMHQALEQQEISISKAGINATLKSRCSLLGAANPKYGRFDQYEPIAEQIELEPALISRFDLIFTVTDQPDEEEDRRLAEHILKTNYAGELNTQREEMTSPDVTRDEVEDITEEVDPVIGPELLRKYVAYAKQNCHPRMTDEAQEVIKEFYTDLRAEGSDEDAPVPVTARKLEALVRLAEASARIRLSDRVTAEDAERVTDIVRSSLEDVGMDPESGEFDADIVEAGTSKSQRDRIQSIKAIVEEIQDEYEEGAPKQQIIERAEDNGIDQSKAEKEIEKLKQRGELYETRTDNFWVV